MDIFRQYANESLLEIFYSITNTENMEKSVNQQIAEALDAAMDNYYGQGKRMSGAQLARLSGVPQPTISRTLSGKSTPETETLVKLVMVLGARNVNLNESINATGPARRIKPDCKQCDSRHPYCSC